MRTLVGINGFGRMGRLALRAGWGAPDIAFVEINEVTGGPTVAAHLLTFDSVHGKWHRAVDAMDSSLLIDGREVSFSNSPSPGDVPWARHRVDVVLECSGRFKSVEQLTQYRRAGVKKVIVAAPVKDPEALNVVVGVNDRLYEPDGTGC